MKVEQLKMIFADIYDDHDVPLVTLKSTELFKQNSYKKWAVNELYDYISYKLRGRRVASIDTIINIVDEFAEKMEDYEWTSKNDSAFIFSTARDVAETLSDVLSTMK